MKNKSFDVSTTIISQSFIIKPHTQSSAIRLTLHVYDEELKNLLTLISKKRTKKWKQISRISDKFIVEKDNLIS